MSPAPDRTLINLAAGVLLVLGCSLLLNRFGIGVPFIDRLSCSAAQLRGSNEVLQLGTLVAVGLLFIPSLRTTGIGLIVLGIAAAYALELFYPLVQSGCSGASGVP